MSAADRRTNERGRASRATVLAHATAAASVDGLEGLTLGALAATSGMSKSGLVTLFGSKVELQLAVLEHARGVFASAMNERYGRGPRATARPRTWQWVEAWMSYERDGVFPGGCFLTSVSVEFATRPGRVHDRIVDLGHEWLGVLAAAAAEDVGDGLLPEDTDPQQVAFGLRGVFLVTNWAWKLFGDETAFARGRALAAQVLGSR